MSNWHLPFTRVKFSSFPACWKLPASCCLPLPAAYLVGLSLLIKSRANPSGWPWLIMCPPHPFPLFILCIPFWLGVWGGEWGLSRFWFLPTKKSWPLTVSQRPRALRLQEHRYALIASYRCSDLCLLGGILRLFCRYSQSVHFQKPSFILHTSVFWNL